MPTFTSRFSGLGPAVGAIIPASFASAAIGTVCLGALAMVDAGGISIETPVDLLGGLIMAGWFILFAMVASTFIVAWYLAVFGLPVVLLLGERIRHPLALAVSLLDAVAASVIATAGTWLGLSESGELSPSFLAAVLCFAIPAGYLYRRNVIAMRDFEDLT